MKEFIIDIDKEKIAIPVEETMRYMGAGRSSDPALLKLAKEAGQEVFSVMEPKAAFSEYELSEGGLRGNEPSDGVNAALKELTDSSSDLRKHIEGCKRLYIFAATLGIPVDLTISRASLLRPSMALALDAAGSAAIEEVSDEACRSLENRLSEELGTSVRLTKRYSPGYGDLALSAQSCLFRLLSADKLIGLKLTESLLMVPGKSVSAVIGMKEYSEGQTKGISSESNYTLGSIKRQAPLGEHKCESCSKRDCEYRLRPYEGESE